MNNLAALLYSKGDYAGAEPLYRRALAIREKALGPEHPDTAQILNNLAELLHDKGDYAGAEPLYRRALAINEKALGPEHPETANSLNNLAALLHSKGDYAGAEPLYRRALAISEKALGPEHPDTATSLGNRLHCCATMETTRGRSRCIGVLWRLVRRHWGRASRYRHQPEQPGSTAAPQRRLRGGGAAVSPCAGDS